MKFAPLPIGTLGELRRFGAPRCAPRFHCDLGIGRRRLRGREARWAALASARCPHFLVRARRHLSARDGGLAHHAASRAVRRETTPETTCSSLSFRSGRRSRIDPALGCRSGRRDRVPRVARHAELPRLGTTALAVLLAMVVFSCSSDDGGSGSIPAHRPPFNGTAEPAVAEPSAHALHPPLLYLGYVLFSVPFAYAIA